MKLHFAARALVVCSLTILSSPKLAADELDNAERALKIISNTANSICNDIPLQGQSSNLELSGEAKAELSKALQKLADLKIQGSGKFQNEEYQGVLQKDLSGALRDSATCKQNMFDKLERKLLSEPRTERVIVNKRFAEEDNIPSGGIVLACLTGTDTKGQVTQKIWLQGPNSLDFEPGSDGMTTSIQYGHWSNEQCGLSGSGWHAKVGTCGTGEGPGWLRCTVVLAKVEEVRTVSE